MASSRSRAWTTSPALDRQADSSAWRGSVGNWRPISASTASASDGEQVTRTAAESGPCSAWLNRSAATWAGSAVSSASTMTSEGPAGMSIATWPKTSSLAAVTHAFPGPTILSTARTVSVPQARAPIACAPPITYNSSTPISPQAPRSASERAPSLPAGVATANSRTPASRAGMADMSTDDG